MNAWAIFRKFSRFARESLHALTRLRLSDRTAFRFHLRKTFVPVGPALLPHWPTEFFFGGVHRLLGDFQLPLEALAVSPFLKRFQQRQLVVWKLRMQPDRILQMFARRFFTANARRPARRVTVKQSQRTIRPGVIDMGVEAASAIKLILHFANELERAECFCARELAEI